MSEFRRRDITGEDLALYAMHLLSEQERFEVEQFLATSPEARQELAVIRGDLASFAMGTEMQTPPALARQRLMKELGREKKSATAYSGSYEAVQETAPIQHPSQQVAPQNAEEPQFLRSYQSSQSEEDIPEERRGLFGVVFPWVGWAAAAALAFYSLTIYSDRDALRKRVKSQDVELTLAQEKADKAQLVMDTLSSPAAQRFVLMKTNVHPPASARVAYLADKGSLLFQGSNLENLPDGKTYELWLIPTGTDAKPVAAGIFKPDASGFAQMMLPDMPKNLTASKFGVTIEDDGGAEEPTMPIVLIGQ